MMNFFLNRYKKWGHELTGNEKPKPALRINTLKISEKDAVRRLKDSEVTLEKINFLDKGYHYDADFSLGSSPLYLLGYYYLQEAASQLASEVLAPKEDDLVLDMCASPGSKTTHLSQLMGNKGTVVALDINNPRIMSLRNNLERLGVRNCLVYRKDAKYADDLQLSFDKVLLDAPCSGNYSNDEGWFEKRDIGMIESNAEEQKDLITSAFDVLKPGGEMVYSTCSLEIEENEKVIEFALEKFDMELMDVNTTAGEPGLTERTRRCRRFWPPETQGFFIARLKKISDE
ncbi:MAG: RsmB/NOP family class I SAM-dependent RNA methyltransferase [Nanobdellota archaeon]